MKPTPLPTLAAGARALSYFEVRDAWRRSDDDCPADDLDAAPVWTTRDDVRTIIIRRWVRCRRRLGALGKAASDARRADVQARLRAGERRSLVAARYGWTLPQLRAFLAAIPSVKEEARRSRRRKEVSVARGALVLRQRAALADERKRTRAAFEAFALDDLGLGEDGRRATAAIEARRLHDRWWGRLLRENGGLKEQLAAASRMRIEYLRATARQAAQQARWSTMLALSLTDVPDLPREARWLKFGRRIALGHGWAEGSREWEEMMGRAWRDAQTGAEPPA